jgi:hypothetical protein
MALHRLEIVPQHLEMTLHRLEIVPQHLEMALHRLEIVPQHLEMALHRLEIVLQHLETALIQEIKKLKNKEGERKMTDQSQMIEEPNQTNDVTEEKKKSYYETMEARIKTNRVTMDLSKEDTTLHGPLALYGYDQTRILAGDEKVALAEETYHLQKRAYEDQYNATLDFEKAWEEADAYYMRMRKVALVAFKDNEAARNHLLLSDHHARSFEQWLPEAIHFYQNALNTPKIIEGFAAFNVTAETLQQGLDLVENAREKDKIQEKLKSEAQNATKVRDAAFDDMDNWMADFLNIARIAFADNSQQLEKFGIVVP